MTDDPPLTWADLEQIERELERVIRLLLEYCDGVPVYRPCRCDGLSFPHRPGCRGCRTDPEVARILNKWRDRERRRGRHVCHCPAYPFPHRPGGGRCNRPAGDPVTKEQARGEQAE